MPLEPGAQLGPYLIVGPLGAGAMGEVYRARDPRLGREVAIKVLPAAFARDAERLQRFQTEARAAGALNHPNVVAVFDAGAVDGVPYVVEELLQGETLRQALDRGPLPRRRALELATQVAQGLAAAHEHGIVHRDLKPENLFVVRDGRAKILDFGLAKVSAGADSPASGDSLTVEVTQTGMLLGTVGYMAPEQARGEPAGPRSDLFALGVILHEMLGGKRPFARSSSVETLHAILHDEPPELTDVPPALARIVARCLEKEPARRFQSALDLAFALQSLSDASSSGTVPAPALGGLPARRRVSWREAVIALAIVGALALGTFVGRSRAPGPLSFRRLTFRTGTLLGHPRIAPDGASALYAATWEGRHSEVFQVPFDFPSSRSLGLEDRMVMALASDGQLALVHAPDLHLSSSGFGDLEQVPLSGGSPRALADSIYEADLSPDGTTALVLRQRANRLALEYPLGHEIYASRTGMSWARLSPDGRQVALFENPVPGDDKGHVLLLDRDGHARVLTRDFGSVQGLAWASDGRSIWFTAAEAGVHRSLWNVQPGHREQLRLAAPAGLVLTDIARNGDGLMEAESPRFMITGKLAGDSAARDLSWFDFSYVDDMSADGSTILFDEENESAGPFYAACLWRASDPAPVRLGEGLPLELSPDGHWVFALSPSTPQRAQVLPTGVGQARTLDIGSLEHVNTAGSWLPDGRHILVSGNEPGSPLRLWLLDVAGGKPTAVSPGGFFLGTRASHRIAGDGRRVLCLQIGTGLVIFDIASGQVTPVRGVPASWRAVRWSRDGSAIFAADLDPNPSRLYRVDLATGAHTAVLDLPRASWEYCNRPCFTEDMRCFAYSRSSLLHDLYLVKGLK